MRAEGLKKGIGRTTYHPMEYFFIIIMFIIPFLIPSQPTGTVTVQYKLQTQEGHKMYGER
jgi:hypothetical protein